MAVEFDPKAQTDLAICRAMVDEFEDYLDQETAFRPVTVYSHEGDLTALLSIGAFLERYNDLAQRTDRLAPRSRAQASEIGRHFREIKERRQNRYYQKLKDELQCYVDSWGWLFEEDEEEPGPRVLDYPTEARHRARVATLLEEAREDPAHAEWDSRLASLDQQLMRGMAGGHLVWKDQPAAGNGEERWWE